MKKVMVVPLDWGLGHAARCIPIIRKLIDRKCEVLIGGSGESLVLLRREFPSLKYFQLPAYNPRYPRSSRGMVWQMAVQIPRFMMTIWREHHAMRKIVDREKIDIVISDNRFGCWSHSIPSIFITHQSNIMMPKRFGWLQGLVRKMNERYMKKFNACWIPDFPGEQNLAGQLATFGNVKNGIVVEHIGPLSRFGLKERPGTVHPFKYKMLAILSGPEPQRSILEKILTPQISKAGHPYFIVRGVMSLESPARTESMADYLTSEDLEKKILESELVIARSGYSTIMDLAALQKKALLVPTPGQTEQEYLARRLRDMRIADSQSQDQFDLAAAISSASQFSGFTRLEDNVNRLDNALNKILNVNSLM